MGEHGPRAGKGVSRPTTKHPEARFRRHDLVELQALPAVDQVVGGRSERAGMIAEMRGVDRPRRDPRQNGEIRSRKCLSHVPEHPCLIRRSGPTAVQNKCVCGLVGGRVRMVRPEPQGAKGISKHVRASAFRRKTAIRQLQRHLGQAQPTSHSSVESAPGTAPCSSFDTFLRARETPAFRFSGWDGHRSRWVSEPPGLRGA